MIRSAGDIKVAANEFADQRVCEPSYVAFLHSDHRTRNLFSKPTDVQMINIRLFNYAGNHG